MEGLTLAFVTVPCFGACLAAGLLRDWRLAGAVAAGGAGVLVLVASLSLPFMGVMWPVLSGAVLGAIVTGLMLALKPDGSIWTRLTATLGVAFVVFYGLMLTVIRGL